jgi:ABC-2 type transport system ATP-binding protein
MEAAAERELAIVLSSHLLVDLERVCDHLVVLSGGEVRLAGDVDDLLATHRTLVGPRRSPDAFPSNQTVLVESHTDRQTTAVVRTEAPVLDPAWQVLEIGLEDLVLAYLGLAASDPLPKALRAVGSAP